MGKSSVLGVVELTSGKRRQSKLQSSGLCQYSQGDTLIGFIFMVYEVQHPPTPPLLPPPAPQFPSDTVECHEETSSASTYLITGAIIFSIIIIIFRDLNIREKSSINKSTKAVKCLPPTSPFLVLFLLLALTMGRPYFLWAFHFVYHLGWGLLLSS